MKISICANDISFKDKEIYVALIMFSYIWSIFLLIIFMILQQNLFDIVLSMINSYVFYYHDHRLEWYTMIPTL